MRMESWKGPQWRFGFSSKDDRRHWTVKESTNIDLSTFPCISVHPGTYTQSWFLSSFQAWVHTVLFYQDANLPPSLEHRSLPSCFLWDAFPNFLGWDPAPSLAILVSHSTWHLLTLSCDNLQPLEVPFLYSLNKEPSEHGRYFIHSGCNSDPSTKITWEMLVDWQPDWWNNQISFQGGSLAGSPVRLPTLQTFTSYLHLFLHQNLPVLCHVTL